MSIEPQPVPESQRLSETQSRQLLELAIKLDAARSTESSIGELRRVAEELNISPAAFDEALRQIQEQNAIDSAPPATGISLSSPQPATSYLLRVLRIVVLLVGGYYVGVSSAGGGLERVAVVLIGVSAGLDSRPAKARFGRLPGGNILRLVDARPRPFPAGAAGPDWSAPAA